MIPWTILTLVLASSFLVAMSEAGNMTVTGRNSTTKCVPVARTKQPAVGGSLCVPYGLDGDLFQNGGYCKNILGNLPVHGRDILELGENEMKLRRYQMAKDFALQSRGNATNGQTKIFDGSFTVRQSCMDAVDDIYCHHYFKRCYVSSEPQKICRETCEELFFKLCDREYKMVLKFNLMAIIRRYPFSWDIINCTTLPFRNESSNCYYPDRIREKLNVLESEDCYYGDGRGYRGNINTTVSGYTCQQWDAQCPHEHNVLTGEIYEEIRNSSNFCRNPGGYGLNGPWCFTTNRTLRWEYCDVPRCAKHPPSSPPADFRGHNTSSTSIRIFWGAVPKPFVNGIILGFHVACKRLNSSDGHFADLAANERNWEFKELEKFMNYSCCMRAYNNFGNGTWSEELVISTDEDVPSAPPESPRAWNLSSTSLHVRWGPIPLKERHGKILGYQVEKIPEQQKHGRRKPTVNYTASRSLTFSGLKKFSKYVISVCAVTRRGKGPSRSLTVQTDEDVPDRPPTDISAISLGPNAVQLDWWPINPEYINGELLGYKVLYNDVNDTSSANTAVVSPEENRLKIGGLRPGANYSFQLLAFTAKGDGAVSTNYFAKTHSERFQGPPDTSVKPSSAKGTEAIVVASTFSGLVVLVAAFLVIYFVRKRRPPSVHDGNTTSCAVPALYAISSPDWLERIITTHGHGYETLDDENVASTSRRQPLYVNIAADGSLDLPPNLRNIYLEFQQSYENTNYKRLHRRRRSLGGAVNIHGHPIYDKLQRVISPTVTRQSESGYQEAQGMTTAESARHGQHHSVDLGEVRRLVQALQGDVCNREMMEMSDMGQTRRNHRRRFSVDLGEVREFIAVREARTPVSDENMAETDQPEA